MCYHKEVIYQLGDIYVGDFAPTISYGVNPEVYSARYGIRGHNGICFQMPVMTPILAAADGWVLKNDFKEASYGNRVVLVHDGFLTIYGHLNDATIKPNERVIKGQLLGHSGQSGLADTPRLHFGIAPCDNAGIKTEKDNGYGGYIDPVGARCLWDIKNLKAPVIPGSFDEETKIPVANKEFAKLNAQGSNYFIITSYLLSQGLNEFLTTNNFPPIDPTNNPQDTIAGEHIVKYLSSIFVNFYELQNSINSRQTISPLTSPEAVKTSGDGDFSQRGDEDSDTETPNQTISRVSKLKNVVKSFIFTSPATTN